MSARVIWAIVGVVTASLASLYGAVLLWLVQNPIFFPATTLEAIILGSQIARLVVILSVRSLRGRNGVIIIDIFAAEILVIPVVLLVTVLLGSKVYLPLAGEVLSIWTSAFLLVFPAFAICRVASMIRSGATFATLIPTATSVFAVLCFVLAATVQSTTVVGLAGMTRLVSAAVLHGATAAAARPEVSSAGIALYLGLILYSTVGAKDAPPSRDLLLVFPVLGAASAVLWGAVFLQATADTLIVFGVPSLVLIATLWLGTREN